MSTAIYVGAKAPDSLVLNVTRGDSTADLSAVTAASLSVQPPSGSETTWTCAITNQSATGLTLTHAYASDGTDLSIAGRWRVYAILTLPTGTLRTAVVAFMVRDEYDV